MAKSTTLTLSDEHRLLLNAICYYGGFSTYSAFFRFAIEERAGRLADENVQEALKKIKHPTSGVNHKFLKNGFKPKTTEFENPEVELKKNIDQANLELGEYYDEPLFDD